MKTGHSSTVIKIATVDRFSQLVQIAIGLEERLLRSVFGQLKVAQDRIAVAHSHVLKPPDNGFISIVIALTCVMDQRFQACHSLLQNAFEDKTQLGGRRLPGEASNVELDA